MDNYQLRNGLYLPTNDIVRPFGKVECIFRDPITKKIVDIIRVNNTFVTVGKTDLAALFTGNTANNKGQPTYQAIGTSGTAPNVADTQLGAEVFRKIISIRSSVANVSSFQTFFDTSEGNYTIAEAGLFGSSATGTANTGTLFCHALLSFTKTSAVTLTITWTVTF